jgi:hypothetical protein
MMHDFKHERNHKELFYQNLSAVRPVPMRLPQRNGKRKTAFDLSRGAGCIRKQDGMQA